MLVMLVPSMRISMWLRSVAWKERESERFRENRDGPGIVLRPASPNAPSDGGANAALLKNPLPPETLTPVASARLAPKFPLPPESDRLPRTRAV